MPSFNKVIIAGNLTRDPELRTTPNNHSICKLSLAVNRRFRKQDGSEGEETTFVDIDSFGKQADVIAKYLFKGNPLLVEGRLKSDSWTNQNGEKRSKLLVVLETFQFISSGQSSNGVSNRSSDAVTSGIPNDAIDEDQDSPF